jgi:hypothetical protein
MVSLFDSRNMSIVGNSDIAAKKVISLPKSDSYDSSSSESSFSPSSAASDAVVIDAECMLPEPAEAPSPS